MRSLRAACDAVAHRARHVTIARDAVAAYAAALPLDRPGEGSVNPLSNPAADPVSDPAAEEQPAGASREELASFWITLDAVNFGSGWFPTLRKRDGLSGYNTVAAALRDRFAAAGPWSVEQLTALNPAGVAEVLGQDPEHELMGLYAASLNNLGERVAADHGGSFAAVADTARGSAVALALALGEWPCFADSSRYGELTVAFLKRAQITAADLHRAGVSRFADLDRLTMFADNLVPHVLRLDGILRFAPPLVDRIDRQELIAHGSPEEVEIRACALHAVELIVGARRDTCAAEVDQLLWHRGQQPRYKAAPRHRSRCSAY